MYRFNKILDACLVALMSYHLVISPYTKVEESFNIQAIHDILNYGVFPSDVIENYDHKSFPGVVPRTFIGSLLISLIAKPIIFITSFFGYDLLTNQDQLQLIVRAILGLANISMLIRLRDSLNKITFRDKKSATKGLIGFWYSILLLSQFHIFYYSSRTLPNFIALPFVNYSLSLLLEGNIAGFTWLAMVGVIFRSEVGLFGGIIAIVSSLGFGESNIFTNLLFLFAGTVFGSITSVVIDSYFWGRVLVPEIDSFIFNVINGNSQDWGTEPWGAYFKKYLPQIFRPPIILALTGPGLISDPADDGIEDTKIRHPARNSLRILFISSIIFVALMSFQPHKEWRFIVYTIPIFTLQAANGMANITMKRSLSFSNKLLTVIISFLVLLSCVLSLQMGYVSSFNYPGGHALAYTNDIIRNNHNNALNVHIDVPACMTGVTKFGEIHEPWVSYDKSENDDLNLSQFDLVITKDKLENWRLLRTFKVFHKITFDTIYKLLVSHKLDKSTFPTLISMIFQDFIHGSTETFKNLLKSTIMLEDYINVYANRNSSIDVNSLRN
ncbi:ECM39 [Candida pseudojiufengensis]|uniref:ECM39 n=1 Tax=Candida pseudojiufengensis TaxID=497109 RepID=UPI00222575B8|nr:ECM39 [Candida pseudojiufengensis]KAI5959948.1 ECM39 [Candida pseudojiufengensis]